MPQYYLNGPWKKRKILRCCHFLNALILWVEQWLIEIIDQFWEWLFRKMWNKIMQKIVWSKSYLNANFLQNFTCNVLIFEVHLVALFQHHRSLTNKTFWLIFREFKKKKFSTRIRNMRKCQMNKWRLKLLQWKAWR